MILKTVEIRNFKSIKFELIEIHDNELCFVGINESGKSSILEAISYLNINKKLNFSLHNKEAKGYPKGMPEIISMFEVSLEKNKPLYDFFQGYLFTEVQNALEHYEKLYIQYKRWGNGFNNISLELSDLNQVHFNLLDSLIDPNKKSEFLDGFFQDYFPVIELYENEDLLIEPASPEDIQGSDSKFETFRRLLYLGGCIDFSLLDPDDHNFFASYLKDIERKFNTLFKKHYRQDESISITLSLAGENKLVLIINDNTEKSFTIKERSPGFQYYFAFLINKLYDNERYNDRNIIFLLDEPGTNLHPKGAKDLLKTFAEVSSKNLLFFTTHNPFLVLRDNLDSLIFVYKDQKKGTQINRKPWMNKYQVLRKELGILLNDSFLVGDINILVEGATEKYALPIIFEMRKLELLEWVNIYNVDGVTKMTETLKFLGPNNLNQNGIVLLDCDKEASDEKNKPLFTQILEEKNWHCIEINEVFGKDNKPRTFEDLFPQDLYIQAFNEYCNSIKDIGVFDKEYVAYTKQNDLPTPIIETLKQHFNSFINEDRRKSNSITKQQVIRHLFEIIKDDEIVRNKALQKCFQLAELINKKCKQILDHVNN